MPHEHPPFMDQDPDDVEPVVLPVPPMSANPHLGRSGERMLLATVHGLDRVAKCLTSPRLHLNEADEPIPLRNEVDISPAGTKAAGEDLVARSLEPPGGDSLAQFTEGVCGMCHGAHGTAPGRAAQ